MPLFVLSFAVVCRLLTALSKGNARCDALCLKCGPVRVEIVSLVPDQRRATAFRQGGIKDLGAGVIRNLARRQAHRDRTANTVAHGVYLGVQSPLGPADVARKPPLLGGSKPYGEP